MSILRIPALAAMLILSAAACSPGAESDAQPNSGDEVSSAGYLTDVTYNAGAGVQTGAEDAPVTMIEYASITCGHCKDFHNDVMKATVYDDYVATGKVKLIFREYPLNQIDIAGFAIARCAGEENYFSVLDTFFNEQDEVISAAQDGTILDKLKDVGSGYGLSADDVDNCIDDSDIRRQIAASIDAGQGDGVNSTPSIFLNGERQETIESRTADGMAGILDGLLGVSSDETAAEPVVSENTDEG